jgi:hypothetical protein
VGVLGVDINILNGVCVGGGGGLRCSHEIRVICGIRSQESVAEAVLPMCLKIPGMSLHALHNSAAGWQELRLCRNTIPPLQSL